MPTFKVTDPNSGRTLRLTGDSPPNQQELEQLFSQFQAQEPRQADPSILRESQAQQRQIALQQLAAEQSPLQAGIIAAGKGLTDVARGLGLADPAADIERRAFSALEKESPISTTIGEVAGQAAPFLVAGTPIGALATIPARIAASTALGATEAGVLARGQGATTEETILSGGVGGVIAGTAEVVLPVIGRIGGRLIRRITGSSPSAPVLDASGRPSAELSEALDKAGLSIDDLSNQARQQLETGDVSDPAALLRKQFLEDQGLTPTRAQVTGQKTDFQTQQELAKTSGRVEAALQQQEQVLGNRFENAITATGGSANRSSSTAFDHIADRSISLDAEISNAYKTARELASDQKIIKANNLSKALKDLAPFNEQTNGLASSIKGILEQRGVINKKFKPTGRIDASTAEQIRIDINGLFDSTTPLGRAKMRGIKDALDNDVAAAVGEDVFAGARSAKAKFESDLRRTKVNKFDKRRKDLVRDILENKISPDRFLDEAILSKSVRGDDVKQLRSFLELDGDGPGVDAWNDVRAEAMARIRSEAFSEVGGEIALSRAKLEGVLNRFGEGKLRAIFEPRELKFLDDMLKVSKLREPKRGTALGLGPSAQAIGKLEAVVKRIPLLANVFEGLATDAQGRIVVRPPSLQAALRPSEAARAIPLALPAAAPAIISQEQQ